MSLVTQINSLTTRIATEIKTVYGRQGDLASLATTDKTSLVAAINEVDAAVGAGGTITADAITDATTTGKNVLRATDAAAARSAIGAGTSSLTLGVTAGTAKAGDWKPAAADITDATTTGRALVAATDAAAARTTLDTYSKAETDAAASNAAAALVDGAPGALDTLNELAAALGDDPNFAATTTTALGNRLRVDAAQTLSAGQKQQGQDNLDVYSRAQIGDPTTDFVAVFEAALV